MSSEWDALEILPRSQHQKFIFRKYLTASAVAKNISEIFANNGTRDQESDQTGTIKMSECDKCGRGRKVNIFIGEDDPLRER